MKKSETEKESDLKDNEGIEWLKAKEAKLRKESAECTEKIKKIIGYGDPTDEYKQRIKLDDAIYHTVGLLEFLNKNK